MCDVVQPVTRFQNLPSTRRLVITADDFGYCKDRDRGILESHRSGAITRASLMVTGASAKTAALRASKRGLPLGLHLNLTEGTPVSLTEKVSSLLKWNADVDKFVFLGKFGFRKALAKTIIRANEVITEIESQIHKFIRLVGYVPHFVDGHQHVHVLPGVSEVFAKTIRKCNIHSTRVPAEILDFCDWVEEPRWSFYHEVVRNSLCAKDEFKAYKLSFEDCYVGMTTMGGDMTMERLQDRLSIAFLSEEGKQTTPSSAGVTCEMMTHPGHPCTCAPTESGCGDGPDEFARSQDRRHEMEVVAHPKMFLFYKNMGIILV